MRTVHTDGKTVTIRISGEAPPGRDRLLAMVRETLEEGGFAAWEDTEADCFLSDAEALVIARPGTVRGRAYFFPGLEELLAGVRCAAGEEGALYAVPGGYVLTLPPEEACAGLCEFGEERRLHPLWETFAREHGMELLSRRAPEELKNRFRQD